MYQEWYVRFKDKSAINFTVDNWDVSIRVILVYSLPV